MLDIKFRSEDLIPIGECDIFSGFSELLCVKKDAERFFASATNPQIHDIFLKAVQNRGGIPRTINIQPAALFDPRFLPIFMVALENNPAIDLKTVCIEITEHGGVPINFNPKVLEFLKETGIKLALDDFDPRNNKELERLTAYSEFLDMIKLPYQIMGVVRNGKPSEKESTVALIESLCNRFRDKAVVMEGVRQSELPWAKANLAPRGVDYVQIYTPESRSTKSLILALTT